MLFVFGYEHQKSITCGSDNGKNTDNSQVIGIQTGYNTQNKQNISYISSKFVFVRQNIAEQSDRIGGESGVSKKSNVGQYAKRSIQNLPPYKVCFAFFDYRAAGRFIELYPQINKWYMAGHSLGGAMAASYVSRHTEDFEGLILLAAYSTHNISDSKLKVLSIYGSKDGVLNKSHYDKYRKNLPAVGKGFTEIIIEGGNHAQFASYGAQKGDFMPEITPDEQQEKTAEEIAEWAGL